MFPIARMLPCEDHKLVSAMFSQPPSRQRLYKDDSVLEDGSSLADQSIENGDVLGVAYQSAGAGEGAACGVPCAVTHFHHRKAGVCCCQACDCRHLNRCYRPASQADVCD